LTTGDRAARPSIAPLALAAGMALFKLWLAGAQALQIAGGALYDDALFVRLAENVARGQWLGPYDHLTLAKGPFYPVWIAGAFLSGVPLVLSHHLLYIAAVAIACQALRPLLPSPWARLAVFAALLFNPASFAWGQMGRAVREGIYPALTLIALASGLALWLRAAGTVRRLVPWSVLTGLALGGYWLTREEGLWIVPAGVAILALFVRDAWPATDRRPLRVAFGGLPVVLCALAVGTVVLVNGTCYGAFTTVEFKGSGFPEAYGALLRIVHDHPDPTVPVPTAARRAAYAVSPALRELRPHLEGEIGRGWAQYGGDGREIHGGWFMWALREAAALEGHHTSGDAARDYYRQMAHELNAACDAGTLRCRGPRTGMQPPLTAAHWRPLLRSLRGVTELLTSFHRLIEPLPYSSGSADAVARFRSMAGGRSRPPVEADWVVQGWAFSSRPIRELVLVDGDGRELPAEIEWRPSRDVERHFADRARYPGIGKSRFELYGRCGGTCNLRLRNADDRVWTLPLNGSRRSLDRPHAKAHLDSVLRSGEDQFSPLRSLDARRWNLVTAVGRGYTALMPWLTAGALLAFGAQGLALLRTRRAPLPWLAAAVLLLAIGTRLALVALIDATSFGAVESRYLSPIYPLLLLFVALVAVSLAAWTRRSGSADVP
jgi:hypothetical protein